MFYSLNGRWFTCNLARTMSNGFVIMVVVKPPTAPLTHCIIRCDVFAGSTAIRLSAKSRQDFNLLAIQQLIEYSRTVRASHGHTLIQMIECPPKCRVRYVCHQTGHVSAIVALDAVPSEYLPGNVRRNLQSTTISAVINAQRIHVGARVLTIAHAQHHRMLRDYIEWHDNRLANHRCTAATDQSFRPIAGSVLCKQMPDALVSTDIEDTGEDLRR